SLAQRHTLMAVRTHRFTNIQTTDRHELSIPIETQEFEVAGLVPPTGGVFTWSGLHEALAPALAAPLAFHEHFTGNVQAKRIGWARLFYYNDALTTALALGQVGTPTLLHHRDTACFTPQWATETYGTRVDTTLLTTDGGYRLQDGYWWKPDETPVYHPSTGFFQLAAVTRPDGATTSFACDPDFLQIVQIDDPAGNRTRIELD